MRVFNKRIYVIVLIIIIVVITGIWYSLTDLQQEEDTVDNRVDEMDRGQQTHLKDAEFTVYNNDKTIRWELTSSEMSHKENNNQMQMKPVAVRAYSEENDQRLYFLTGTEGYYTGENAYFKIKGPVNLEKGKYKMETGNLTWYQDKDLIKGSQGLKIRSPEITLTGDSFKTDTTLTTFIVYGNKQKQAKLIWKEREDDSQM